MLFNRLVFKDEEVAPAAVGSLLPDFVDKPLAWVLRVTPSSHYLAHTPLAGAALSLMVARLWGSRTARSFGSAYLLHLLADELHHGRVPWLMPFSAHKRLPHRRSLRRSLASLISEIAAFALARCLLRHPGTTSADEPVVTASHEGGVSRVEREGALNTAPAGACRGQGVSRRCRYGPVAGASDA